MTTVIVLIQHALTHEYHQYSENDNELDAFQNAKKMHKLGLSGEIHERKNFNSVKIKEFHGNEKFD